MSAKKENDVINLESFREKLLKVSGQKTQKAVAEDLGIEPGAMNKIITGKQKQTLDLVYLAATKYNCSIDYLMGLDDRKHKEVNNRLTAREVCKMLLEIIEVFPVKMSEKEKEIDENSYEADSYKQMTGSCVKSCREVSLTIPADYWTEMWTDLATGEVINSGMPTACLIEINKFLSRVSDLNKIDGLDDDMKSRLIASYLADVSEDISPIAGVHNKKDIVY